MVALEGLAIECLVKRTEKGIFPGPGVRVWCGKRVAPSFGGYCGEERIGRDGRVEFWKFLFLFFGGVFVLGIFVQFFLFSLRGCGVVLRWLRVFRSTWING